MKSHIFMSDNIILPPFYGVITLWDSLGNLTFPFCDAQITKQM